ncbi:MAG: hypothetical protein LUE92_06005 [Clostridiales bacterium]|nr:hypothetical protein [Clostridiales bacterium]
MLYFQIVSVAVSGFAVGFSFCNLAYGLKISQGKLKCSGLVMAILQMILLIAVLVVARI